MIPVRNLVTLKLQLLCTEYSVLEVNTRNPLRRFATLLRIIIKQRYLAFSADYTGGNDHYVHTKVYMVMYVRNKKFCMEYGVSGTVMLFCIENSCST